MNEQTVQTHLGNKIKKHWNEERKNGVFELKFVNLKKRKSLPFADVKPHQVEALVQTKKSGIYHKISDQPIFTGQKTRFNLKKPFDFFFFKGNAYVCICFYEPRYLKEYILIDIDVWEKEKKKSKRKSINLDRSRQIGITLNI